MKCLGFDPITTPEARVLILGSLPGRESLKRQEYYAKAGNSFWWIMGELIGASPGMPYQLRCERLREKGIALWDVCRSAERDGSLDTNIIGSSVDPNDFKTFLAVHSQIQLICFNGQRSEKLFRQKVSPYLKEIPPIQQRVLGSTSPAHTVNRADKLKHWREALSQALICI